MMVTSGRLSAPTPGGRRCLGTGDTWWVRISPAQPSTASPSITPVEDRFLDIGTVATAAEVWLNGERLGARAWDPYWFRTGKALRQGTNELRVQITNTLANYLVSPAVRADWAARKGPGWPGCTTPAPTRLKANPPGADCLVRCASSLFPPYLQRIDMRPLDARWSRRKFFQAALLESAVVKPRAFGDVAADLLNHLTTRR